MEPSQLQYSVRTADRYYREVVIPNRTETHEIRLSGLIPKITTMDELELLLGTEIFSQGDTCGVSMPITSATILDAVRGKANTKNLMDEYAFPNHRMLLENTILFEPEANALSSSVEYEDYTQILGKINPHGKFAKNINDSFYGDRKKKSLDEEAFNNAWTELIESDVEIVKLLEGFQNYATSHGASFPIGFTRPIHANFPESLSHAAVLARENIIISGANGFPKVCSIAITNSALRNFKLMHQLIDGLVKQNMFGQPEIVYIEFEDCDITGNVAQFMNFKLILDMLFPLLEEKRILVIFGGVHIAVGVSTSACGINAATTPISGRLGQRRATGGNINNFGNGLDLEELEFVQYDVLTEYIHQTQHYPSYGPTALGITKDNWMKQTREKWNLNRRIIAVEDINELNRLAHEAAPNGEHQEGVMNRLWHSKHARLCQLLPGFTGDFQAMLTSRVR